MQQSLIFVGEGNGPVAAALRDCCSRADVKFVACPDSISAVKDIRKLREAEGAIVAAFICSGLGNSGLEDPLTVRWELHRAAAELELVFLSTPEAAEAIRNNLSPVHGHWTIASSDPGHMEELFEQVMRRHPAQTTLRANLERVSSPSLSTESNDPADYHRLLISDRYLASILTHAQDVIISTDNFGKILTWNLGAERLLGYSSIEAVGKNIQTILSDHGGPDEISRLLLQLREGQPEIRRELALHHMNGDSLEVEATLAPVRDDRGKQIGISIIARDIRERKRSSEALQSSEKLAATGRLAATIAHEINNPLEAITNLLYLLQHNPSLDDSAKSFADMAQKELARVTHIARQMLGFYRESPSPVTVSLRQIVENVIDLYARKATQNRNEINLRGDVEGEIEAYPSEMRQVFSNLVVNAMEAAGKGGKVLVHIYPSRDWLDPKRKGFRVTVVDDGPGISSENVDHIFEPFFTTKGERGTGLGLWVTRGIVEKHGGSIKLRSRTQPGRSGTMFSLFLPSNYRGRTPVDQQQSRPENDARSA